MQDAREKSLENKEYGKHYNRKLLRGILRNLCWNDKNGNVNRRVHDSFQKVKDARNAKED